MGQIALNNSSAPGTSSRIEIQSTSVTYSISQNVILNITAGDILTLQVAGDSTSVHVDNDLHGFTPTGAQGISASLTVSRVF